MIGFQEAIHTGVKHAIVNGVQWTASQGIVNFCMAEVLVFIFTKPGIMESMDNYVQDTMHATASALQRQRLTRMLSLFRHWHVLHGLTLRSSHNRRPLLAVVETKKLRVVHTPRVEAALNENLASPEQWSGVTLRGFGQG